MKSVRRNALLLPLAALAAAVACAPAQAATAAADANRPASLQDTDYQQPLDPATVRFGEVMFDYYTNQNFQAITSLQLARDEGILSENDDYAEMLLGDLYTTFGLVDTAEQIFSKLVKRDILSKTRNETWFHTAELQYNQGKYDDAARILENKIAGLPPDLEKERVVMLGNIYIQRGEFQKAADLLSGVKADDILGAYALYNAGVALVRAGEIEKGMPLLKRVRDLPPGDEETNALKDRAALAIGFTWLQKNNNDLARESLLTIRMDGPFTNQAMLGLGYANFQRGDYKKALPLWLELLQRNTSDTTVQEALMLAPRAYEELGALPQALFGYRYAANTLRDELKKVERTIIRVKENDWIDTLSEETSKATITSDPLAPVTNYTPANIPEAPYLYSLFASKEFGENYKLYLELKRIERLISYWQDQIPIYRDTLTRHRVVLADLRPKIDEVSARRARDLETLKARLPAIEARIENAIHNQDIEQTANPTQLAALDRIDQMSAQLERSGYGPAQAAALRERIRRVRGVVLWDIASSAPKQQEDALKDIETIKYEFDMARTHLDALDQDRKDIDARMGNDFDVRLGRAEQRLTVLKADIDARLAQQTLVLQNQALVVLAENRRNLGSQLAETHLSIARLQDTSVSEAIEKRKQQQ